MNDLETLARLTTRIDQLESRIATLEFLSGAAAVAPGESAPAAAAQPTDDPFAFSQEGGVFAVLGKAMLGIAGAYLLRAVAESGSFPKLAIAVLALIYAASWLVWAARVPATARFASTVYATTSVLILAPMLSELTLRFKVLPSPASAIILGAFAIAAYVLAWKRSLTTVVWVANVAAVLIALALLLATHDLVPFLAALLSISVAAEAAAAWNRWLRLRPVAAVAADLAACLLLYIYSRPEGLPPGYRHVGTGLLLAAGCTLFVIHAASTVYRTMRLGDKITAFEIGQTLVAFLLAAFSLLYFGGAVAEAIGVICLLFSIACYAAAYAFFDRFEEPRNHYVYGVWSAVLFLAGSFLCLTPLLLALALSLAAIVATFLGVRASRLTLQLHGLAYLAAAGYASGLLTYAGAVLAGTFPSAPGGAVWLVAPTALACYAIVSRVRIEMWRQRLLQLVSTILAVGTVVTVLISLLVWLAAHAIEVEASHVAVVRTLVTCLAAIALAFSSSRLQRSELAWIAYGILALVAAKLLFEDLQHGNAACTAGSIFAYAVALIFVPRLARGKVASDSVVQPAEQKPLAHRAAS